MKIWAVAIGNSLYAREFVGDENFKKNSGQWRSEKLYMPGNLLAMRDFGKYPGSSDRKFSICPSSCFSGVWIV